MKEERLREAGERGINPGILFFTLGNFYEPIILLSFFSGKRSRGNHTNPALVPVMTCKLDSPEDLSRQSIRNFFAEVPNSGEAPKPGKDYN